MFLATHATVGAIIGRAAPNPLLAFLGGFISHFLLDMIPHGDAHLYENYRNHQKVKRALAYVTLDAVVTAYLILGIRSARQFDNGANVTAGIIGGLLPDLIIGVYNLIKVEWLTWFHNLHFFFHNFFIRRWQRDIAFSYGLTMQIVVLALMQTRI
ncbi:hypothetical protein EPN90_02515 [Patescibacteria group bacterium]|nr:MAG: hypothetical protein EPN90_02515 [Patescibacteria group bacterium]